MDQNKIAILLIGFGGPTSPREVRPFIESVLRGIPVSEERIREIQAHYDAVGGASPYNAIVLRQKEALERWFEKKGSSMPVLAAFRHSRPAFKEAFLNLKKNGIQTAIVFILSPFRSQASFGKYQDFLASAQKETKALGLSIRYIDPFHSHPLFISAQCRRIEEAIEGIRDFDMAQTFFLFSVHSILVKMSEESGYARQFLESASCVAQHLGIPHWGTAYQSRSGSPAESWLKPDVKEAIRLLDPRRYRRVVLVPIGFLCENVEILYDLDIEARAAAQERGLEYRRAGTLDDHPDFVELVGSQVLEKCDTIAQKIKNRSGLHGLKSRLHGLKSAF